MGTKASIRTCIACGISVPRAELVRVVRSPQGQVSLDARGKADGRGAYVCLDRACFAKAVKKHAFDSKLRKRLSADEYIGLEKDFDALSATCAKLR